MTRNTTLSKARRRDRLGARRTAQAAGLALAAAAFGGSAAAQSAGDVEEVVVTASARAEARSRITGTVEVIGAEQIEASSAKSMTDLLAESAVGLFSEWSPGQTSINIRGGATDGQGRDFKSQVLVLVNGRRAGTANLSKLSPSDVERIEVVRGPSSVVYGSQNIGGVINIIPKTGKTQTGVGLQASVGSWELARGAVQAGGELGALDWYLGASAGQRDDYRAGKGGGTQVNTSWKRRGVSAALGLQLAPDHRVEFSLRNDGIYDAGFRGSASNYLSKEDRFNTSGDLIYTGALSERLDWKAHLYAFSDTDDLKWASPIINSNGVPTAGTSSDHNIRKISATGFHFQPHVTPWKGNDLLVGWDWEESRIRSSRERIGVAGAAITQVAPYDNNQTERVNAFYAEDVQSLFDDRLTLRAGIRRTEGKTRFDLTPNLAGAVTRTSPYAATTYAVGATYKITPSIVLRASAATGFRAPNATELAADFVALGGGRTFGNPNLEPETSQQYEVGAIIGADAWRVDLALFENTISDRIIARARPNAVNTSDYVNNGADVVIRGAELQADLDLLALLGRGGGDWSLEANLGGNYNFDMVDKGAAATASTNNVERVYKYQASIGAALGQARERHDWSFAVNGVLHGPVWYNTEEFLLIPVAEPTSTYIHRKDKYWVWDARGEVQLTPAIRSFAAVTNLLNANNHPLFIGLDQAPYTFDQRFSNGGRGTSMIGRALEVGVKAKF